VSEDELIGERRTVAHVSGDVPGKHQRSDDAEPERHLQIQEPSPIATDQQVDECRADGQHEPAGTLGHRGDADEIPGGHGVEPGDAAFAALPYDEGAERDDPDGGL
jgi:hypothetical protein